MGDLFVVELALDLGAATPGEVVDGLSWHLGTGPRGHEVATATPVDRLDEACPLLADRGPAARTGGLLVGELIPAEQGWSLTVRQEVHAESLPDLDPLLEQLARHSRTGGVIGQIRFYEDHVPELLISEAGTLVRMGLEPSG
ncbi:hypothetical protein ABZY45_01355 [Streptomyces sp. NPDC006516]|uniref:hypothetical protein n=1 Tax=Streptomyces sp. NPDC006516 TaxID=3154309 RepID=UPI0033BBE6A5